MNSDATHNRDESQLPDRAARFPKGTERHPMDLFPFVKSWATKRSLLGAGIFFLIVTALIVFGYKGNRNDSNTHLTLRLQWYPQSQFAGFIVAKVKGFYEAEGLDVELLPAGPDLKPQVTVATGADDLGVGVPNQIISARSNGVPLVAIAQVFQDSPNRYVIKDSNRISTLADLRGKKVGLWLGGDEAEFIAMLRSANMTLRDVNVIPQGVSIVPFIQDQYILSQVTVYNELNLLRLNGYGDDTLQVLSPADYNAAILGDVVFTMESTVTAKRDSLTRFLRASLRGWQFCMQFPEEALDIVLHYNPELKRDEQALQLKEVLSLATAGFAKSKGLGFIDPQSYEAADRILFETGQITTHIDPQQASDMSVWNAVEPEYKTIPGPR